MEQFLTMAFAQLTSRESLWDIEFSLRAQAKRRYAKPVDLANSNIVCVQTDMLTIFYSSKDGPAKLRRVVAKDKSLRIQINTKKMLGQSCNLCDQPNSRVFSYTNAQIQCSTGSPCRK